MRYVHRELEALIVKASRQFPAIVLTGPRRAGKTFLLKRLLPRASYVLLEDPDVVARIDADPRGFLDDLRTPAILDEIQNAPRLIPYIRSRIDLAPRSTGQWLLTGSQEAPLMKDMTESLAGRAAVFQLMPFSFREIGQWSLLKGGYPEVWARPSSARLWFSSYIQTYLERDVRAVTSVRDLPTFRRFLSLLAARHGQVLNKTDIAAPLGVSVPTVAQWMNILEVTNQILIVPPFFENLSKRIIKSPRLYWADAGLACHLLGIESARQLEKSPFLGSIFEGFIASELVKNQVNVGRRRELYFFRDQQGLEVDFLAPGHGGTWMVIEAKASRTVVPPMAKPVLAVAEAMGARATTRLVVYRRPATAPQTQVLARGVKAVSVEELLGEFS